ncbi:LysR family transcriptional regulator [Catenovulum sediminis]|uniref:LysR family transcriptional regulator n=1 Tax=Catenovulum sediminis TaxID=1740262 RepID=A0ABV1RHZ6_9ALTE
MLWHGVSEFVAVVDCGSFIGAAEKLGVSNAQVSRQVSALEERLNIKLLYRTTRKINVTQEGQVFYQHCRHVLDGLEEAERAVTNLQSKPKGKIKLTAPVTYGEQVILPKVTDFMLQYPDIQVYAHLTNQNVNLVDEGYDLAVRLGKLADSSLMARKLASRINYICASADYIRAKGQPQTISMLDKHACLLGSRDHWVLSDGGKEKIIKVSGKIRYNSGHALLDAALKGLGLVQLPDYYVAPYLASGDLVSVLDEYIVKGEGIWAIYPQNRHLSPKIRLLVDYLAGFDL